MTPRRRCVGCGNPVPENQQAPYPGHRRTCPLAARWRAHDADCAAWHRSPGFRDYVRRWGHADLGARAILAHLDDGTAVWVDPTEKGG